MACSGGGGDSVAKSWAVFSTHLYLYQPRGAVNTRKILLQTVKAQGIKIVKRKVQILDTKCERL